MGAKKGNQNALGNEGGRPALFTNAIDLQNAIDQYFNDCPDKRGIIAGENIIDIPVYTISGLAYHLGFESRQSLYDYQDNIEFSCIIKRARLRIESKYEQNLSFNNATGSIFALKNMDWKDSQAIDHTTKGKELPGTIINNILELSDFDTEDLKALNEIIKKKK